MGLFSKKPKEAKEQACSCGGKCNGGQSVNKSRFLVLGACCKKSAEMFANTKEAVANLGFADVVENVGDMKEIAQFGVMQTPALVLDGKVVSVGKLLSVEQIEALIGKK